MDGVDVGVTNIGSNTGYADPGNTDWTIGAFYNNSYWFRGKMDDVRIYNRALSAAEVAALARGDEPGTGAATVTLQDPLTVSSNMVVNAGTLDVSGSNYAVAVGGMWENNGGVFVPRNGTVTLNASSGTKTVRAGNQAFYALAFNGAGTWNFVQSLSAGGNVSIATGTVNLSGYDAMLYGGSGLSFASSGNLNLGAGMMSVEGDINFTNSGTITPSTSTLIAAPSGSKTLTSAGKTLNNFVVTSTDSLVGWWKIDDGSGTTATDSSGSGNNGTLTNGPAWAAGKIGDALSFDGSNDYVEIPSSANYDGTTSTWCFWFKGTGSNGAGTGTSSSTILGRHDASGSRSGIDFISGGSDITFEVKDSSANRPFLLFYDTTTLNQWHHVCGVTAPNGGTASLYVDGVLKDSATASGAWSFNNQVVRLADSTDNFWGQFAGSIDDVRIYSRVLTPAEIAALYRGHPLSTTGTVTLQDALDIDGNVYLGDGTLAAGAFTHTVAGNWTNTGATFTAGASTVNLNGVDQTIYSSERFNNLTKTETTNNSTDKVLTIEAGTTVTVAGTLTLSGLDTDDRLNLVSSTPGTRFTFDITGASQTVSWLDVMDSNVSDSATGTHNITATHSLNSGNNDNTEGPPHWMFGDSTGANALFFGTEF